MSFEQIKAIVWLRWRLSANQFVRGGALNAALGIFLLALLALGAVAFGAAGFLAGLLTLGKAPAVALLLTWDGILFVLLLFWAIGVSIEVQRSESIDLSRLLHLPITPSQVFVFNYIASHFTPILILFVPGMLGLVAGVTFSAGPWSMLSAAVVLAFVFMLTAWTYCLRGWLAALMTNKRRRRAVVLWLTIGFVAVSQLPNLVFNSSWFRAKTRSSRPANTSLRTSDGAISDVVLKAHLFVPPGWIGYSAVALKSKDPVPALAFAAAAGLIGTLGLLRAYRFTIRYYRGVESSGGSKKERRARRRSSGKPLVEQSLPWLRDDTAALALATLRGLLRAPELKMAFITPLVFIFMFGFFGLQGASKDPPAFVRAVAATAAAALASFSFAPTLSNAFGLDRNGFRALVLLPTNRHEVLLAKNLAFFPFIMVTAVLMVLLAAAMLRLHWLSVLTAFVQVPSAYMLFCLVTNMACILVPYRFSPGTLQAKKPKAVVIASNMVMFLVAPVVVFPLALPPILQLVFIQMGWAGGHLVSFFAALVLLAGIGAVYWQLLPVQGRLLQRRELAILKEVTEENE